MGRKGKYRARSGATASFPTNFRYFPVPLRGGWRVTKALGLQSVIALRGRLEKQESVFAYALKVAQGQHA